MSNKVLGIDLGSGFSCMALLENGEPTIIPNSEGQRTTPSIVAWTKDNEILVGQSAKRQAISNSKRTVYEIKRFIGRKFSECEEAAKLMPYEICSAENGDCRVKIGDKMYSPEEISAMVLKKLKRDAESYLGEEIKDAVITVPAYFSDSQKQATKNAGIIAGFNVLRIINEPTSSALSYGSDKNGDKIVAVFDDGSCTTDVSILSIGDGVVETLAVNGTNITGGRNYDERIMKWLIEEFKNETGIDLSNDSMAIQRIKDESEKAKIALSTTTTVEINLPFISADSNGPKHLIRTLSRAKFEQLVDTLNDNYIEPVKQCIKDADKKIDEVILVGGTCRIPSVQKRVEELFGIKPKMAVNLDESVACGAAIQGGIIRGEVTDVLLLDVTPLDIGIETMGEVNTVLIPRNTTIPTKKSQVFSTAVDNQPAITVRICQGNRPMFKDNKLLGQFNLDGIPPAPRGVPQEEITIDIDSNGIINVTAKDLGTNKEAHITITSSSGLSKEEIEKAKKDAELNEAEDKKRMEVIEKKNKADGLVFSIEKFMKDSPDKITDEEKTKLNAEIEKVKEALKNDDVSKIEDSVKSLEEVYSPIVAKMYQQSQQQNGTNGNPFENMAGGNPFNGETPKTETTNNSDQTVNL